MNPRVEHVASRPRAYGRRPLVDRFSATLGLRLRAARRQRGWSLGSSSRTPVASSRPPLSAHMSVGSALSVQRLVRLAEIYAVPAADLLPLVVRAGRDDRSGYGSRVQGR